jgi:hypothetical protein
MSSVQATYFSLLFAGQRQLYFHLYSLAPAQAKSTRLHISIFFLDARQCQKLQSLSGEKQPNGELIAGRACIVLPLLCPLPLADQHTPKKNIHSRQHYRFLHCVLRFAAQDFVYTYTVASCQGTNNDFYAS